jgi:peptide/nickel transport system permease protein
LLVTIHLGALAADFIAPYDYSAQFRDAALAPPTPVGFGDRAGDRGWRPVVRTVPADSAQATTRAPIRWFVPGSERRFGPFVCETRLFGVEAPARLFLLGTDESGRDLFSRLLYGARISLFAGLLAAAICVLLGFSLGTVAGFYGGRLDELLMRFTELFMALPWLYLLFAVRAILPLDLGPGRAFLLFIVIVGTVGWARPARLFRGVAVAARGQDFVLAARAVGASDLQLMLHHVAPQSRGVFWTQLALLIPRFILAEVTLSFLGLGVAEPVPSWGNMLATASGLAVLHSSAWTLAPAAALLVVVLCYQPLAQRLESRGPAAKPLVGLPTQD